MSLIRSTNCVVEHLNRRLPFLFPCPDEKRELQESHFFEPVLENLKLFSGLELRDHNFDSDLVAGSLEQFYGRYWEIEIAIHFHRLGYSVRRGKQKLGPDFVVASHDIAFHVEARTLHPTSKLRDHIVEKPGQIVCGEVPVDEILLRYTQALSEKKRKISAHFSRHGDDGLPIVVALNAYRAYPFFDSAATHLPFVVRAVLPFGSLYLTLDTETMRTVDRGMHYRDTIYKKPENQSPVPTDAFLKIDWRRISAVLATHRMFERDLKHGIAAAHNPIALAPLKVGVLGARSEYTTEVVTTSEATTITTVDALAA